MSVTEPRELAGLTVSVDRVIYHPRADLPPERPHCYVYFITIINQSDVTVTLRARKWVVRNGKGQVSVLEGDGIVGQTPTLAPGET
ncbi:MAG TPA: ApaG domain, partial [Roseimicrobium sp.]|nr:ApaG domain [Roseimicrobium sp.]